MDADFVLVGNDFADRDQFSLSLIRKVGETHLLLGDTKPVENSVGSTFSDNEGHTFQILLAKTIKTPIVETVTFSVRND